MEGPHPSIMNELRRQALEKRTERNIVPARGKEQVEEVAPPSVRPLGRLASFAVSLRLSGSPDRTNGPEGTKT